MTSLAIYAMHIWNLIIKKKTPKKRITYIALSVIKKASSLNLILSLSNREWKLKHAKFIKVF